MVSPGVQASEWDYTGETYDVFSEDSFAVGLAQDENGDWWLLGGNTENVYKYDSDWTYLGETHDVLSTPEDIYLDENGDWWITSQQHIYKYDSNWNYIENHSITADAYFVAAAQDDNLDWWMLGTIGDNVYKYYDNWDYTGLTYDISSKETSPEALWGDIYGNWWISGVSSDNVHKYDSNWNFVASYSPAITVPIISPTGVSQDSDGNWWISDVWNDNVFKFQGAPEFTTSAATDVVGSTVTLNGTLDSMGSFQSANLLFQFRKQGDSTWLETSKTSGITSPTSFSKGISSLSGYTIYEFRTVVEYNPRAYGSTLTFTTDRITPPVVEPPEEEEPEVVPEVPPEVPEEVAPAVIFTPKAPPKVWYAQYMEAQERPPDAPFPTLEPLFFPPFMAATEATKGPTFISSAFAMLLLAVVMLFTRPKSRLDETPQNWTKGSGSGSWTFISKAAVVIVGFSVITAVWMLLRFGFGTMSVTYGVMAAISMLILMREQIPNRTGAFIGFGKDKLREAIFGGCFGVFFLLLMGWVGHWIGVGGGMSMITTAHALPLLLLGVIIPFHEEIAFRGVIAPTITEKYGMALAIGASGLAFGAVHLLFGGTEWLFAVTTIFGIIMGFFALRQQSIVLPLAAHIAYNSASFILFIILQG